MLNEQQALAFTLGLFVAVRSGSLRTHRLPNCIELSWNSAQT
jgi:hypothetical protein